MNSSKPRKQYTTEFKAQAIELLALGRPVAALSEELCISANLLYSWKSSSQGARVGMIIHHTDADREVAFDRESHIGKLDKGLDTAMGKGWIVTDMKADWKTIFSCSQAVSQTHPTAT